jgi:hypothetical protein
LKCADHNWLQTCGFQKRNLNKIELSSQTVFWPMNSDYIKTNVTSEFFNYDSVSSTGNHYGFYQANDPSDCRCEDAKFQKKLANVMQ